MPSEHFGKIVGDLPLRRRGFAPALSDEEVIALEVCGEYLGFDKDEAIFDYFVAPVKVIHLALLMIFPRTKPQSNQAWFPGWLNSKIRTSHTRD